MAWDEWDRLKGRAAERQSAEMQLNRLPPEDGGGSSYGDLTASQTELARLGSNAFDLLHRLWGEGRVASPSSSRAAADLKAQGFDLGGGLAHVAERWDEQLGSVRDACAHISRHMRVTKKIHQDDEEYIRGQLSSIASLDRGFDERVGAPGARNEVYGGKKDEDAEDGGR
ncbi:hypothetical protein [Streptomyces sp. C10-9-1]|uniref:hypothetical protein n=1 Tax=Streptomyces sp. C10-9-1 TaxID=1859285 RepID=UPI003D72AD10